MSQVKYTNTFQLRSMKSDGHKHEVDYEAKQRENSKASWQAIASIASASVAGVAVAVGHDRYNAYLSGKQVDEILLPQEWVNRIATAFAFLVSQNLAIAVSTSYVQRLWKSLRGDTFEVGAVDIMMGASSNIFSLLQPSAWRKAPGLLIMALTIW